LTTSLTVPSPREFGGVTTMGCVRHGQSHPTLESVSQQITTGRGGRGGIGIDDQQCAHGA
jgi:hypothetical protein